MEPILKAEHISKTFGEKKVLEDVSLSLNKGEIISLLGVSGSGKTTLFNILSGIYRPDEGQILLSGKDITGKPGEISYMLQKDLLFPYRRVIDNVTLPLLVKGKKKKEARAIADPLFETFGLSGYQMKYPEQLSGGMRQRAALLRTYLSGNGVALLDEPFSALDTITKSSIHTWYLDIMSRIDLSTVFITHDIDEAILLSDRVLILSGVPGKIKSEIRIEDAKPRDPAFNLTESFISYKRQIVESLSLSDLMLSVS